ncbi:MAG: hypothetical protein H6708_30310 [Kofleriaceae bacterium]|nr:hypothetical protein [Kofleriaceae bacterium]
MQRAQPGAQRRGEGGARVVVEPGGEDGRAGQPAVAPEPGRVAQRRRADVQRHRHRQRQVRRDHRQPAQLAIERGRDHGAAREPERQVAETPDVDVPAAAAV